MNQKEGLFFKKIRADKTLQILFYLHNNQEECLAYLKNTYATGFSIMVRDEKIEIMAKEYKDYIHLLEFLPNEQNVDELIKKNPSCYKYVKQYLSPEQREYCLIHYQGNLQDEKDITSEKFVQIGINSKHEILKYASNELLSTLTDEQLKLLICSEINNFYSIPKERMNRELLLTYLEKIVKDNIPVIHEDYLKSKNIPDELMDKTYYQCMAMVNGYNYRFIPREYLSEKLIWYTLKNQNSFIGYVHLLNFIPDEFKTEEICLKACIHHFAAIEYIPERYKNKEFYQKLIESGQYRFLKYSDIKTVPYDMILKCVSESGPSYLPDKFPKKIWTQELALAVAKWPRANEYVPASFKTRDFWKIHVAHNGCSIKECPKNFIDESLVQAAIDNNSIALRFIPDVYKTNEFYKENVRKGKIYPKNAPAAIMTKELLLEYIEASDYVYSNYIPTNLIDYDVVKALANKNHRSINLANIKLENQTKELCSMLFSCCKNSYEKMRLAPNMMYISEEIAEEIIRCSENGILALKEPTVEQIALSLSLYPENALYFDTDSLTADDSKEREAEIRKPLPKPESAIPDNLFETVSQLSLFDLFELN